MKAYYVRDKDREFNEIIFAETSGKAKAQSEARGWCEFTEIEATREKRFDKYVEKGFVPKQAMLEAGWYFECEKCFSICTEDNAVVINEEVYCEKCSKEVPSE